MLQAWFFVLVLKHSYFKRKGSFFGNFCVFAMFLFYFLKLGNGVIKREKDLKKLKHSKLKWNY